MMLIIAGLFAGFIHVLSGPDHLAAIAPYAVEGNAGAWRTGVRWGLGHGAGVLGVALVALLLRGAVHVEALSAWSEILVGVVLIAIGARGIRAALTRGRPGRDPRHATHRHTPFAIGTIHGLAGSSHVLGIAPALLLPSSFTIGTYLLLFAAGSVAAMGLYSSLVGRLTSLWVAGTEAAQSALLAASSALAMTVGAFWLASAYSLSQHMATA